MNAYPLRPEVVAMILSVSLFLIGCGGEKSSSSGPTITAQTAERARRSAGESFANSRESKARAKWRANNKKPSIPYSNDSLSGNSTTFGSTQGAFATGGPKGSSLEEFGALALFAALPTVTNAVTEVAEGAVDKGKEIADKATDVLKDEADEKFDQWTGKEKKKQTKPEKKAAKASNKQSQAQGTTYLSFDVVLPNGQAVTNQNGIYCLPENPDSTISQVGEILEH